MRRLPEAAALAQLQRSKAAVQTHVKLGYERAARDCGAAASSHLDERSKSSSAPAIHSRRNGAAMRLIPRWWAAARCRSSGDGPITASVTAMPR